MIVKLWGVRGSISSPISNKDYHEKISGVLRHAIGSGVNNSTDINQFISTLPDDLKYIWGGNTTCASVTSSTGITYILDCGTGIRELGYEMMKGDCCQGKGKINIFLTHNHWDHIQGLPFFTPLYVPGNEISFYSPYPAQKDLLSEQMKAPFFPADFMKTPSEKKFHHLDTKNKTSLQLEKNLTVDLYPLKHPNGCYAYRFREKDRIFIFATDCEFTGESLEMVGAVNDFFMNADLLILDAQYTLDESFLKIDWGHTSYTMAVNCGIRWKVKNLVLTHHEPSYSDAKLHENYLAALEHRDNNKNSELNIFLAREGMTFKL